MKYYYVYYSYEEWGKGYIGRRECTCLPHEDTKYFGSFKDKSFQPVQKIILSVFDNREEMCQAEVDLHLFFEVDKNPHFANKAKQTSKNFSFDFTGVKRDPRTNDHIENHKKSLLGRKWYYKCLEDGSFLARTYLENPGEDWTLGRGPTLKRQDRKDLKWFHKVNHDGEIERKLAKIAPSDDWKLGSMPEGSASQSGTQWYSTTLPDGSVKCRMFRKPPGDPWVKGRLGFTRYS